MLRGLSNTAKLQSRLLTGNSLSYSRCFTTSNNNFGGNKPVNTNSNYTGAQGQNPSGKADYSNYTGAGQNSSTGRADYSNYTGAEGRTNTSAQNGNSNFTGAQNQGNSTQQHNNFSGAQRSGVPLNKMNVDADALMSDASKKHSQAARTGDAVLEIEARIEQSIADRVRRSSQYQTASQQEPISVQEIAQALKVDAAQKQSIGMKLHDPSLLEEASMEQSLADTINPPICGQNVKRDQQSYGASSSGQTLNKQQGNQQPSSKQQQPSSQQQQPSSQQQQPSSQQKQPSSQQQQPSSQQQQPSSQQQQPSSQQQHQMSQKEKDDVRVFEQMEFDIGGNSANQQPSQPRI